MLEDRVTARTNAGEDSNEFDPAENPSSSDYASKLVGNLTLDSWVNGNNATVEQGMLDFQVIPLPLPTRPTNYPPHRHLLCRIQC